MQFKTKSIRVSEKDQRPLLATAYGRPAGILATPAGPHLSCPLLGIFPSPDTSP